MEDRKTDVLSYAQELTHWCYLIIVQRLLKLLPLTQCPCPWKCLFSSFFLSCFYSTSFPLLLISSPTSLATAWLQSHLCCRTCSYWLTQSVILFFDGHKHRPWLNKITSTSPRAKCVCILSTVMSNWEEGEFKPPRWENTLKTFRSRNTVGGFWEFREVDFMSLVMAEYEVKQQKCPHSIHKYVTSLLY